VTSEEDLHAEQEYERQLERDAEEQGLPEIPPELVGAEFVDP
jgi:hypothetical protein